MSRPQVSCPLCGQVHGMETLWRCEKCGAKLCKSQTYFGGVNLSVFHYVYNSGRKRRYGQKGMIEEECGPVVPMKGNLDAYLRDATM